MKSQDRHTLFSRGQLMLALLVAGPVFFVVHLPDLILQYLPPLSLNIRRDTDILFTFLLVTVAVVGILWRRFHAFFQRWNNNKGPVVWDNVLLGTGIGVGVALCWQFWFNRSGFSLPFVLFGCIVPVCAIHWFLLGKKVFKARVPKSEKDPSPIDEALTDLTLESDAFGRRAFVSALASAIEKSDPAYCHVLGLVGAWGSGKTTVITAVANKFEPPFHVVRIDSWAFRDTKRLIEAVLASVVRELDEHYLFPNLKRSLSRYLSIISPATKDIPLLDSVAKVLASSEELDNLKAHIEAAISASGARFLVLIDDVDRLDGAELQSLLKTVRLCASLPRIVYVLAYDRHSIYHLIASDSPDRAHEYMDKVVEDEWVLPLITPDRLRSYLLDHLPAIDSDRSERFSRDFEKRFKDSFSAIRQLLQTPRQIKRAGISLSRRSKLISRLNPYDAFVWDLLRQRQPMLYELINRKPWLLRPDAGFEADWVVKMFFDKQSREKHIKEIEKVISQSGEDSESVGELFWILFPKEGRTSDSAEAEEIRLRRICNSRFFNAYFLIESGEDVSRPDEIDALVDAINNAHLPGKVHALISEALKSAFQTQWLQAWIPLLRVFCGEIKTEHLRSAIDAIYEFANGMETPANREAAELGRNLAELNVDLVACLPNDAEATLVVRDLLTKTANLFLASVYAYFLRDKNRGYGPRRLDTNQLSAVFDKRLDDELMGLKAAIFKEPISHLATLLGYYSNKQRLWDFIQEVAGESAENWAKVLVHYVLFWNDGRQEINTEGIGSVPDKLLTIAYRVLKTSNTANLPDHEQKAARAFLDWWSRTHGNDGPDATNRQASVET